MARPGRRRNKESVTFGSADAELVATLENLDGAKNYADWIFHLAEPHLRGRVLEVGAGHGTFTPRLAGSGRTVVATELSERSFDLLTKRFVDREDIEVIYGSINVATEKGPYDAAVLFNVLEHIDEDEVALRELVDALDPGGRLVLWVPALPALYSDFDRRIGHFRRYRMAELRSKIDAAGMRIEEMRYVNSAGALAWLVRARLLRGTPTSKASVAVFDRYAVPALKALETRYRPPLGLSIFAAASKVDPAGGMSQATPDRT
jgi:SAM-dependent methyltransferase